MLEARTLSSEVKLDFSELPKVLLKLSDDNWKPAILESYRTFLYFLGIEEEITSPRVREMRTALRFFDGDVFFKGKDLYYIIVHDSSNAKNPREFGLRWSLILDESISRGVNEDSDPLREDIKQGIQIGVISPDLFELEEKLLEFAKYIEKAVTEVYNDREPTLLWFDWREINPGTPHLDKILSPSEGEKSNLIYRKAEFKPEESNAALILTSKLVRETLIEISQAGIARERDILNKKGKQQSQVQNALVQLKQSGLLDVQFLLECKKHGTLLTQVQDTQLLEKDDVQKLLCPSCGESFANEIVTERYSLSQLGRKMIRKNHWMTVWVTEHLVNLGVPIESIIWDVVESSEEVDLLVEFLGQFWVFELKDKEFASNHAHALSFRQVRYHADKAFIITTEKVSPDAKAVFDELVRERKRSGEGTNLPIYIEGLNSVEENLRVQIFKVKERYASEKLRLLRDFSGYNIIDLYSKRIKKTLETRSPVVQ